MLLSGKPDFQVGSLDLSFMIVIQRYMCVDSNSFYSTIAVGVCGAPRITEGGIRCPKGVSALGIHGVRRAVAAAAAVVRPWRS